MVGYAVCRRGNTVVKQGDIIKTDFDPSLGHEQAGYRPALVVSPVFFIKTTNLALVCPITNSDRQFPTHVKLSQKMKTTGFVMAEQIRAVDLKVRHFRVVERVPKDIMEKVSNLVKASVDVLEDYEEN